MAYEILYTSAPRGLRGIANGFTTVVQTHGIPATLATALERLASYRRPGSPFVEAPVKFFHQRLAARSTSGKTWHVLGRIAPRDEEVSGRDNFLAHLVALDDDEMPEGGPAWLLQCPGFMETSWDGEVGERPDPKEVPSGDVPGSDGQTWGLIAGNPGWARWLAQTVKPTGPPSVHVVYGPEAAGERAGPGRGGRSRSCRHQEQRACDLHDAHGRFGQRAAVSVELRADRFRRGAEVRRGSGRRFGP